MATHGRRKLAFGAALVLVVLLVGQWGLTVRALFAAEREVELRHQQLTQLVFDEVGRASVAFLDREEARSFLEYRYAYVPAEAVPGSAGLVLSPLAQPPDEDWVAGYFQIDPDGQFYSPRLPRPGEEVAGASVETFDPAPLETVVRSYLAAHPPSEEPLRALAAAHPPGEKPAQQKQAPAEQKLVDRYASLSTKRGTTSTSNMKVASSAATQYTKGEVLQNIVGLDDASVRAVPAPAPAGAEDVLVSRFRGGTQGDHLLLVRTVRLGRDRYVQGLVLDRAGYLRALEEAGLEGTTLAPYLSFGWDTPAPRGVHHFDYSLAEPVPMSLSLGIDPVPEVGDGGRRALLGVSLLSSLVALAGALFVGRSIRAELDLAQRRADFVSAVTHELKTPLTSIRMYGEMLRDGMVPDEARHQHYYEVITQESERLTRLIQNVLDLGRIERKQLVLRVGPVELAGVLGQVEALAGPQLRAQGFRWTVEAPSPLPTPRGDNDALQQVLLNLVDNAAKFSAEAEVKEVALVIESAAGEVRITVQDRGPGVPEAVLGRIFEPFFRGEHELVRKTQGTGIGLGLAAGLVRGMGGRIAARNRDGGGLEVEVVLPLAA